MPPPPNTESRIHTAWKLLTKLQVETIFVANCCMLSKNLRLNFLSWCSDISFKICLEWPNMWDKFLCCLYFALDIRTLECIIYSPGYVAGYHNMCTELTWTSTIHYGNIVAILYCIKIFLDCTRRHFLLTFCNNCTPVSIFCYWKLILSTIGRPGGVYHPLAFFPCNVFYDSNRENRLSICY